MTVKNPPPFVRKLSNILMESVNFLFDAYNLSMNSKITAKNEKWCTFLYNLKILLNEKSGILVMRSLNQNDENKNFKEVTSDWNICLSS